MSHLCIIQFSLDREVVSLAHRTRTNILVESQGDFAVCGKYAIRCIRIANHLWASHILIEGNDLRRLRHLFTTEVAHRNGTDIPLSIRISIIVCHTEDIIECTFIRQQALVLISSRFLLADYPLFHGKPLRIALLLLHEHFPKAVFGHHGHLVVQQDRNDEVAVELFQVFFGEVVAV